MLHSVFVIIFVSNFIMGQAYAKAHDTSEKKGEYEF